MYIETNPNISFLDEFKFQAMYLSQSSKRCARNSATNVPTTSFWMPLDNGRERNSTSVVHIFRVVPKTSGLL